LSSFYTWNFFYQSRQKLIRASFLYPE
jgi:hypothetical protein